MTAAILVLTACGNDLVREHSLPNNGCVLTLEAHKGRAGADTRGLKQTDETSSIEAIWSEGDRVTVLSADGSQLGTMVPLTTGSASTKLKAELHTPVSIGDNLTLVLPRTKRDYTGQKGTLADIAAKYDYATDLVTVVYADESFVSATDANFANQQAIVKFNLRETDGVTPIKANSLTVSATGLKTDDSHTGDITITPEAPTSEIYAALSGISNQTVNLSATTDTYTYTYATTTPKSFEDSNYYNVLVKMTPQLPPSFSIPLTLECASGNGATVTVQNSSNMQYKINDGEWSSFNVSQINLKMGDKVSFRGNWSTLQTTPNARIVCSYPCYVYGNIMSLVYFNDFATKTDLPFDYTFQQLFMGLNQADGYRNLLRHKDGYDLVLPAATLREGCYFRMFYGNRNLDHIVCLATDISAKNCTYQWLYDVKTTGTFVKAAGINVAKWSEGESGIPIGWTVKNQ